MIVTNKSELIKKCQPVSIFDAGRIVTLLELELNKTKNGIGLSANQIGIDAAVCIIRYGKTQLNLVNPEIIDKYDLSEFHYDGCLSFPGDNVITARHDEIVVVDSLHPNGFVSGGMEAVVIQHEIDHLNGITMFEREIKIPQRNKKCWCGSGKKYKICHLNNRITFV